jgi:hypothetical protein
VEVFWLGTATKIQQNILNPAFAVEIVMSVESPIKQTLFRWSHTYHYNEREKVAKLSYFKGVSACV